MKYKGIYMYQRNLKYIDGHGNFDEWVDIPKKLYDAIIAHMENHAKEKGFTVQWYMEFIKENVVREV